MRLKKVLTIAIILVVIAAGAMFAALHVLLSTLEDVSVPNRTEICKITGLNLSDDVRIIGAEYRVALDASLYLALDMSAKEVERLFPETEFKPSTTVRYLEDDTTRERDWFVPNSIVNFKSFSYTDNKKNAGMYALYDNTQAKRTIVYILWFEI